MKEFIESLYKKPHFIKRFLLCLIAVCVMGMCVSWLNLINLGTDPCSAMNFGISGLLHMSFGNWQALFNTVLFFIVIFWDKRNIGFGTLLNMFMVGYSCDFMTWLRQKLWPNFQFTNLGTRILTMILVLIIFVFVVSIYMSVDLGTAPYDAIPIIISNHTSKISFRMVRILFDGIVTLIAFFSGSTIGIVTVLMCFMIGPAAAFMKKYIVKYIN